MYSITKISLNNNLQINVQSINSSPKFGNTRNILTINV